jgi:oligo-1,6-glucosidase
MGTWLRSPARSRRCCEFRCPPLSRRRTDRPGGRRRLPDLPAQLRRLGTATASATCAGIISRLDYLAGLGVDVVWLSPVYPSPQDDNGYDISDYQDIDPVFGTLDDFDALLAGGARARHQAGHGPRGQPHLRRAPVVRRVARAADSPKRDWYWWRRPATASARDAGRRADQLGVVLLRLRPGSSTRRHGRVLPAPVQRKQPDLNWENPEVRQAVHAMMRWWLDRGVDGFRMDVINLISKDPALPDGPDRAVSATAAALRLRPADPRVPAGDASRGVRRPARSRLTGRRDAGVTIEASPAVHRPGPGRGRHGVPVRARPARPGPAASGIWVPLRLDRPQGLAGRWQAGSPTSAGTACTGTTTTSRASVSRFGDDGEYRVRSAKHAGHGAAPAPRDARTSTRAKSSG